MMFFLPGDVLLHLFEIGLAYRKIRIPTLPFEVCVITPVFLQPDIRDAF